MLVITLAYAYVTDEIDWYQIHWQAVICDAHITDDKRKEAIVPATML